MLIGIVALLLAVVWGMGSERRALRALPEQERAALIARIVDEMRQFCGEGRPDALKKHCHDLATFAAKFEECREECQTLVRIELAPPPPR